MSTILEQGQQAERLLRDEFLQQTFADLHTSYIDQWRNSVTTAEREALWAKDAALRDVQGHLQILVDRMQVEAKHAERAKSRKERTV